MAEITERAAQSEDILYLHERCPISQPKMSYISTKDVLYLMEALTP